MKETKKNRWVYLKFALIILASALCGGLLGFGIIQYRESLLDLEGVFHLLGILAGLLPILAWVVGIGTFLVALILYFHCKIKAKAWDGEDETVIEAIERKLNAPLTIANVCVCLDFLYFTLLNSAVQHYITPVWYVLGVLAFLFMQAAYLTITILVVGLEKKLNPEKRGNVLDTKFQKEWISSCDEAEQKMIHKAGFQAHRAGSMACLLLWMVTALAQMAGFMGPWPGIMLMVVWLVMTLSYTISCLKQDKAHGPL